jgi:hypothetical protein
MDLLRDACRTSWDLFKVMIPILVLVKILQELGVVRYVGTALEPVMGLVGLPGEMGLVWATAMLVNLYGGMAAFVSLSGKLAEPLSVAQVSVLTTMMLLAHGLPLECRICQKAGARFRVIVILRVLGALLLGWLLHRIYTGWGLLERESATLWQPEASDPWLVAQAKNLAWIFAIILVLLLLLRLLKQVGLTDRLTRLLEPGLRLLGMSRAAAPITIIGMTMGLSYGGGLIIREAKSGALTGRDVFFALALMSLCHSLIEDTFLMIALGGHWTGVFLARTLFALLVVFLFVRLLARVPDRFFIRPSARSQSSRS